MKRFDITLGGSLLNAQPTRRLAIEKAREISEDTYPGRLVRVHDVDGVTVIAEIRDGHLLDIA